MKSGDPTTLSSISYDYSLSGKDTDKVSERTADSPTSTRTDENWTPFTWLAANTQSGATTSHTYAGIDDTQRLTRDSTTFTNSAVGITSASC
ncbi:hypothetical protein ACFY9A_33550 [Streptomyces rubradiris]|uniref:hypothetical protein n=1 Tax=Streptomyces rubradiris TaxID=285531 RepID=UPI0036E030E1